MTDKRLFGDALLEHVKGALIASYTAVREKQGMHARLQTHSDVLTAGDLAANEALMAYFNRSALPVVVYTEEAKPVAFSDSPLCSAICDDIDGTFNFESGSGMLPHGTIVGLASSANPRFRDMQAAGFLEFNSGNLYYAVRGSGSYLIKGWASGGDVLQRMATSGRKRLADAGKVIVDSYMLNELAPPLFEAFRPRAFPHYFCAGAELALLASGSLDVLITGDNCHISGKKRTGEEIAPLTLLVKEAGGFVLDWNGRSLSDEVIGLGEKRAFHYVAASSLELAQEAASKVRSVLEVSTYMARKRIL